MKQGRILWHKMTGSRFAEAKVRYEDGSELLITLTASSLRRRLLEQELIDKGISVSDLQKYAEAIANEKSQDEALSR